MAVPNALRAPADNERSVRRETPAPDSRTLPESQTEAVDHAEIYRRLAEPFDVTFKDIRGGVELEYITGEQCASRLNEVLGVAGWSFRVLEHGIHAEADECWALGEISATISGQTVSRQQFGSQKIKRSRSSGVPIDIGFDLKGAGTDALKKCASLLGVALYLWKKDAPVEAVQPDQAISEGGRTASEQLICEECGDLLTETYFKDGTNWAPAQLAGFGRRKHRRVLCMAHYREANQARRRAEEG